MKSPIDLLARGELSVLLFLFVILNGSCSPASRSVYISPEYRNLKQSTVSVLVLPYVNRLISINDQQLFANRKTREKKFVTEREIELFENYFHLLLAEKTPATIFQSARSVNMDQIKLKYMQAVEGEDLRMDLFIPTSGQVRYNGEVPEYLFLAEDLYFTKGSAETPGVGFPGQRGSAEFFMDAGIDYLLWDNKNARMAACGTLTGRIRLLAPPSREQYLKLLETFADAFVQSSPLAAKVF